ncbi:penicillin-binding transpeptidase domain-containing protein [Balneolaceae bacterium ANBcel3]|nr:penicillin-binding transpeptidase domain-containing protein [Balneolaceae bacterium ANBcel3]
MSELNKKIQNRMLLVWVMIFFIPIAIGMQVLRIQWINGPELRELWSKQTIDYLSIPAQRGIILDSSGRELVGNTVTYTIAVDPLLQGTTQEELRRITQKVAGITGRPVSHYRQRIANAPTGSRYVVLERNMSEESADHLREMGIRTLILEEQYRRRYNYESLASHALGYVNHELRGMAGLEAFYDTYLQGEDGRRQMRRSRGGGMQSYVGAAVKQPRQGNTLVSTIDAHIQAIVEEELKSGVRRAIALGGSVLVMDPKTGAIKAMASYPTYDPNRPADFPAENRKNSIISDLIEPGSTFKLVTAVAAVEQNKVALDERFDTGNGVRLISGQIMRDHDTLGVISFHQALQKSSNIATSEVASRLAADDFYQYARNMGFGSHTYIDLPGEENGRLRKPFQWTAVTKPWLSIGYEVQVTLLQLAQAYAAFANDGVMMRPYMVSEVLDGSGKVVKRHRPEIIRRAIKPSTVQQLLPVFEDVISEEGTAVHARVEGIRIAGKTGTAQKYIDGRYRTQYLASFAGFFPAEDPQYVMVVMIDEPRLSYYGGFIAGPVFRNVAQRIIGLDERLHIAPQVEPEREMWAMAPELRGKTREESRHILEKYNLRYRFRGNGEVVVDQHPSAGEEIMRSDRVMLTLGSSLTADTEPISEQHNVIPDVRGMSMRKASLWLRNAGYEVQMVGSGTVYAQFPEAGQQYRKGQAVTVRGRARDLPQILSDRGAL